MSDVTIGVTAFLRYPRLVQALKGIAHFFPECQSIVASDGNENIPSHKGTSIHMVFDSGLCAKRNAIVGCTKTKYLLMCSDDYEFASARSGVEKMKAVLDRHAALDVAGGRVNGRLYEGFLDYHPGSHIREIRLRENYNYNVEFYRCDITANYFLARTNRLLPWPEELKIGGEHAYWFLKMKQAGALTCYVPDANIDTQQHAETPDPAYVAYRRRAYEGHRRMKEMLDIKTYVDFDGRES
ncbi:Uncharacterised protein [uncultured archaeon]|nr:Uncharacterised protein [uncultured archaeon]